MTLWFLFALMTAAAVFAVLWPLGRSAALPDEGRETVVYTDQLAEIERDLTAGLNIGVRHFQQNIDDQLATLFGVPVDGGPKSPGHYYVASAGAVDADG